MTRNVISYVYFGLIATVVVVMNLIARPYTSRHPDHVVEVLYLTLAVLILSLIDTRIEHGRLSLSGLAIGATSILLNPMDATLVGLAIALAMGRRGAWPIVGNASITAFFACLGAIVASQLHDSESLSLGGRLLVLAVVNGGSLVAVAVGLAIRSGESVRSIVAHNFTRRLLSGFRLFRPGRASDQLPP